MMSHAVFTTENSAIDGVKVVSLRETYCTRQLDWS